LTPSSSPSQLNTGPWVKRMQRFNRNFERSLALELDEKVVTMPIEPVYISNYRAAQKTVTDPAIFRKLAAYWETHS